MLREEYGRVPSGSGCELGDLCSVIPIGVVVVIVIGLVLGLLSNIAEKGFVKGLYESALFNLMLAIFAYVGFIFVLGLVVIFIDEEFGKGYSIVAIIAAFFCLRILLKPDSQKAKTSRLESPLESGDLTESSGSKLEKVTAKNEFKEEPVDYSVPAITRKNKK